MAVTNPDAPPYLQASMIIVPTGTDQSYLRPEIEAGLATVPDEKEGSAAADGDPDELAFGHGVEIAGPGIGGMFNDGFGFTGIARNCRTAGQQGRQQQRDDGAYLVSHGSPLTCVPTSYLQACCALHISWLAPAARRQAGVLCQCLAPAQAAPGQEREGDDEEQEQDESVVEEGGPRRGQEAEGQEGAQGRVQTNEGVGSRRRRPTPTWSSTTQKPPRTSIRASCWRCW